MHILQTSTWSQVTTEKPGILVAFGGNMVMDINIDPGYGQTTNPDMVLSSLLGPDVTMTPYDCSGLSDWHRSAARWPLENNMALGGGPHLVHLHSLEW